MGTGILGIFLRRLCAEFNVTFAAYFIPCHVHYLIGLVDSDIFHFISVIVDGGHNTVKTSLNIFLRNVPL